MATQSRAKELLNYNPETGLFHWRVKRSNAIPAGKRAGTLFTGKGANPKAYLHIRLDGKAYFAHRLAFIWMLGRAPYEVDHDNGNGLDNRWVNLNAATRLTNGKNQKRHRDNTSGTTGVCWDKSRSLWMVTITVAGVIHRLGRFKDKGDAITVRIQAEADHGFHMNHGSVR